MEIRGSSIDEIIRASITALLSEGKVNSPSKGQNLELTGVLLDLENPLNRISRTETKNTLFSCLGELSWYLSGSDIASHMTYYLPEYTKFAEDDGTVRGAYGPRLLGTYNSINQLENVISLLCRKTTTRQAVIQIFDKADLIGEKKDIPCTQALQFLLRDNYLELIVTMRSNDVFRGLPHDIFCFTMLQEFVANELSERMDVDIKLGGYKHFVGSFHLYDKDKALAHEYLQEGFPSVNSIMQPMPSCSYKDIEEIVKAERNIRDGVLTNFDNCELSSYWVDLGKALRAFHLFKEKTESALEEIDSLMRDLENQALKPILQKLLARCQVKS